MAEDYLEQLDSASLRLLAAASGIAARDDGPRFFREEPTGIRRALSSPGADVLLAPANGSEAPPRLLQIAIAIHRTADDICAAGWSASDRSPVDLPLLRFAGQGKSQAIMIDLLASCLPAIVPPGCLVDPMPGPGAGTRARLDELIELCSTVAETERAGALRLLGDEALFTAGIASGPAAHCPVTPDLVDRLETVLPRAVRGLLGDLSPQMHTRLDVCLQFGPIWYRMATQNLLHRTMRSTIADLARDFAEARRFLVRVAQGPLAELRCDLFAVAT